MSKPFVYLVGAGPGDPELITLKAIRCLEKADCVLCDGLANRRLIDYTRPGADVIYVAKRGGRDSIPQEAINDLLVKKALEGKTVVRLKGGDPTLFARGGEEAVALIGAKIPFEIVPGITSGLAAAEYCGIFLTDRNTCSQVVFVTGHPAAGRDLDFIDWDYLARFDGSIVLYMAMSTLDAIALRMIAGGKPADTPAAVIQNATLPEQKMVRSTLCSIAAACKEKELFAPAIVILGNAADSNAAANWFMSRPLFGKTVVITRDPVGNQRLGLLFEEQGAQVVDFSCIDIQGPLESPALVQAAKDLGDYDWVVFTSSHGVDFAMQYLKKIGKDSRAFGSAKIACIGKPTSETLQQYGIRADFVPTEFTAKALAAELAGRFDLRRKNVLLLRSAIAADALAGDLCSRGAAVEDVRIYTTVSVRQPDEQRNQLAEMIGNGRIDWLTFTSSSTVRGFFENIEIDFILKTNLKIASIGPETTRQLMELGLSVHLEAQPHTIEGLVQSVRTQQ